MKDSSFLWYDKPASAWTQALPIGNGTLGGMIYGKVKEETVSLNHDELWTVHPKNTIRPGSLEAFQKARALALDGKLRESQDIIESDFMSTWSQAYLPLGDLVLTFDGSDRKSDYIRSLDLDTAIASAMAAPDILAPMVSPVMTSEEPVTERVRLIMVSMI